MRAVEQREAMVKFPIKLGRPWGGFYQELRGLDVSAPWLAWTKAWWRR